jgi:hypothetical protein
MIPNDFKVYATRTAPHSAKQIKALVTDVQIDALEDKQVNELIRSAGV